MMNYKLSQQLIKIAEKLLGEESKTQIRSAQEIADQTEYDIKLIEAVLGSSDLGTTNINTVAKWLKIAPSIVEEIYSLAFK